jgi:Na+-transporting methylmalonyl-CoA/oxaloacetate decarboxylase beta subunit
MKDKLADAAMGANTAGQVASVMAGGIVLALMMG